MATRTSHTRRTITATSAAAALEIIAGAAKGFWLRRLELTLVTAAASVYSIGRPAAAGITPTTPVLFPMEMSSAATQFSTSTAVAWGTGPTIPTVFYRQTSLPAAIGAGAVWVFDNLWIPLSTTIVLWNGASNAVADVNLWIDE